MSRRRRRGLITESNSAHLNADMPGYSVYDYEDNVEAFLRAVKVRNRSADTIVYYRRQLLNFRKILESQGISTRVDRITKAIIEQNFIEHSLEERGHKYTTIATRLRAIRAFFNWLVSEKVLKESPMQGIVISDVDTEIETYSREQIIDLLRQPNLETFVGYRDYVIMTLFLETGVRLRELVDIKLNDLRMEDSQILINGKGAKLRLVPIQKKARRVLTNYLKIRGHSPSPYLFITQDDGKMSRKAVQDRLAKYGRMSNITNVRNSPHTFRHTFAKMSVKNGANIFELQKILGHETLEMVRKYVNLFSSDVLESHRKFSPIENLHLPENNKYYE